MKGFFTLQETQSKTRPDGKLHTCVSCGLVKGCQSPKIPPYGNFKKEILIVGEAPGRVEDEKGKPWQGKSGRFLKRTLKEMGVDLFEDCLSINAVCCRPVTKSGEDRAPTGKEIDSCRRNLIKHLNEYQPKIVLLLGDIALDSFLRHRWKKNLGTISKWRGWAIPDQEYKTWVYPTFHPSFVIREDKKEVDLVWKKDLQQAIDYVDEPFRKWKKPNIEFIEDLSIFSEMKSGLVSIDYETTGLKPHAPGHRIVCASVSPTPDLAYVFMMSRSKKERQPFIDLLKNERVRKMAHNMRYEENWSVVRLKQSVIGWDWDSMLATHILDNRPDICSLKFQTYVRFGLIDYDSEISPYLRSKDGKDGNSLNEIMKLVEMPGGKEKLMEYCGMDTVTQYRLAELQMNEMNYSFLPF